MKLIIAAIIGVCGWAFVSQAIVVRNNKRGPTKFSVDTSLSYPEYE